MKIPVVNAQFNVYVDGGQKLLGLAEATLPSFEGLTETLRGAGIMGEMEIVAPGQFSALTLSMSFRMFYGDPLNFAVGKVYHFDLRSAMQMEDSTSYEQSVVRERYSCMGQIKVINPGTRKVVGFSDASIDAAVRRVEHFVDGKKVLEFDPLNDIYLANGVDIYKDIRAAIS